MVGEASSARGYGRAGRALPTEFRYTQSVWEKRREEQLASLMDMDCQLYQGCYFTEPKPVEEFERMEQRDRQE